MKYRVSTFFMFIVVYSSFLGAMEAEPGCAVHASESVAPEQMSQLPAELIPYILSHVAAKERVFITKQLLMEIKKGRQEYLKHQVKALKSMYKNDTRELTDAAWDLVLDTEPYALVRGQLKKELLALVQDGADVNLRRDHMGCKRTSLFEELVDLFDVQLVRVGIAQGARVDRLQLNGKTPLAQICKEMERMRGCHGMQDYEGEEDLVIARVAREGRDVMQALIEGGANPDVVISIRRSRYTVDKKSALEWVFGWGEQFEKLAQIMQSNSLQYNMQRLSVDILLEIITQMDLRTQEYVILQFLMDMNRRQETQSGCLSGREKQLKNLLKAQIPKRKELSNRLLEILEMRYVSFPPPSQHKDLLQTQALELLEQGAVPHKASSLKTPFQLAVCARDVDVVRAMIEHGANIHKPFVNGATPLACVCTYLFRRKPEDWQSNEKAEAIKEWCAICILLLEAGADPTARAYFQVSSLVQRRPVVDWFYEFRHMSGLTEVIEKLKSLGEFPEK